MRDEGTCEPCHRRKESWTWMSPRSAWDGLVLTFVTKSILQMFSTVHVAMIAVLPVWFALWRFYFLAIQWFSWPHQQDGGATRVKASASSYFTVVSWASSVDVVAWEGGCQTIDEAKFINVVAVWAWFLSCMVGDRQQGESLWLQLDVGRYMQQWWSIDDIM